MYQEETIFARKYAIASYGDVRRVFEGSLQADTYQARRHRCQD